MKTEWWIFYDDGRVFANTETHALDLPLYGVVCIVQRKSEHQKHLIAEKDFYLYVNNFWIPVSEFGFVDYTMHRLAEIKKAISGRTLDNACYDEIYERARTYL